ncbi:hypothetical protein VSR68_10835 [Paraburkholderia phymatum]|uniref:hypothetical protein n=1 Tax=Paraburkholderia phymatum TaxID=148447 RepID=UPI00316BD1F6
MDASKNGRIRRATQRVMHASRPLTPIAIQLSFFDQVQCMFASRQFSPTLRKWCEGVGDASIILLPAFFLLSLALLGSLSLHGKASRAMVSATLAFSAAMVVVTGMLLAASEQLRRSSQLPNLPRMLSCGLEPSMQHAVHASVGEAQGCQGASPDCALCAMGGDSLRLACEHRACCGGGTACNASFSSRPKEFIRISVHNEQRTFDSRVSQ